jgi:hypothetical protein
VQLLIDAHRNGIEIENLQIESSLALVGTEQIIPDATVEFRCSEGRQYRFFLELDTASERVATMQRLPSSIQKKLERAINILRFGAGLINNHSAQSVYASFLPELLASSDSVTERNFLNHRLEPIQLVRKPRFCQLGPIIAGRDRIIAQLSQKEFTPWWTTATVSQ